MTARAPCGKLLPAREYYIHTSSCKRCIIIDAAKLRRIIH